MGLPVTRAHGQEQALRRNVRIGLCTPEQASYLRELRASKRREDRRTRCPMCGCTKSGPRCTLVIDDAGSVGVCVPRGEFGVTECSACAWNKERAAGWSCRATRAAP